MFEIFLKWLGLLENIKIYVMYLCKDFLIVKRHNSWVAKTLIQLKILFTLQNIYKLPSLYFEVIHCPCHKYLLFVIQPSIAPIYEVYHMVFKTICKSILYEQI